MAIIITTIITSITTTLQPAIGGKVTQAAGSAQPDRWVIRQEFERRWYLDEINPDSEMGALVREMKTYSEGFLKGQNVDEFFHRKSERVVLALLHVEFEGKSYFFRGMNTEVSLPTGSLCAERAAISYARSTIPTIERKHMKGVAVLEVPIRPEAPKELNNPLPPCGACREWLDKIAEVSEEFYVLTFSGLDFAEVSERLFFWHEKIERSAPKELDSWICKDCGQKNVPLSKMCKNPDCKADRFGPSYHKTLTEQKYYDILERLHVSKKPTPAEVIAGQLNLPETDVAKMLKTWQKNQIKHGNSFIEEQAGEYSITEQAVDSSTAGKKAKNEDASRWGQPWFH
eukprot:CAMPEP_0206454518 /NCGR_PEP_ID=MMETSP0324_2-20121206/21183_1 /ASSEMBLY_ACC=CAM_ASM_000836 /TAXON_ID=2866 /ORGANISM="Crypthecodinium cohnii, Strain Seligo" /LENGTH=342 /DNA_ID=CAMNT_0053925003 /DNA_START=206 /DNA_END=1234 /DNA_ORIENTATION=+